MTRPVHITVYADKDLQALPDMQWAMNLSAGQLERLKSAVQREIDAYKSEEWNEEDREM